LTGKMFSADADEYTNIDNQAGRYTGPSLETTEKKYIKNII